MIQRLRMLEQDHEPDGWPAVQMRDITACLDEIEQLRSRERLCPTMDEAEARAMLRALQECANALDLVPQEAPSPSDVVAAVRQQCDKVATLSAALDALVSAYELSRDLEVHRGD